MKSCFGRFVLALSAWIALPAFVLAMGCVSKPASVIMATPLSSRINRIGDPVQAILEQPLVLDDTVSLPAGTLLNGRVVALRASKGEQSGQIQFRFTRADGEVPGGRPIAAMPATDDGWLRRQDAGTPVWQVSPTHSTRLLNEMIQRRLGTDRTVWAQVLGINANTIPDVTTDDFMQSYNRNDVLLGAGDRVELRFSCLLTD
jgi:hypothetical protein